jgi:stage IV sporulation protein FA
MAWGSGVKRRRAERIRAIIEANRAEAEAGRIRQGPVGQAGVSAPGSPGERRPVRPSVSPEGVPASGTTGRQRPDRDAVEPDGFPLPDGADRPGRRTESRAERDPETEWKRRSREWLAASDESRAPGMFDGDEPRRGGLLRSLLARCAVSAALFLAVWGLFRLDEPWAAAPQRLIAQALTEDMDTRAAAEWYRRTFAGSPAFLPIFGQEEDRTEDGPGIPVVAPVASGEVVRPFAETLAGVEIAGESGAVVTAAETGRVTHVTGGEEEGYSVVIRHAGKRMTVYGRLGTVFVEPDDWVEAGDRIGALPETKDGSRSLLYFAVRVDGRYVDPADVVPLD